MPEKRDTAFRETRGNKSRFSTRKNTNRAPSRGGKSPKGGGRVAEAEAEVGLAPNDRESVAASRVEPSGMNGTKE